MDGREMSDSTIQDFLDGIERKAVEEEHGPRVVYSPRYAKDTGAEAPPDRLDDPVWTTETGWVEESDVAPEAGVLIVLDYQSTDPAQ